jgi:excinuclease UvrABC nuclease subunit
MKWNNKDESDLKIQKVSEWTPLDQYKELEHKSGVYIFADDNYDVKYIGKAGARRLVLEHTHVFEIYSAISRSKDDGATQVKTLYTNSNEFAKKLETELIQIYNPNNNIYLKDSE